MPLTYLTGRSDRLEDALTDRIAALIAEDKNRDIFVIVPQQRTLFTEKMLLGRLSLSGSFTLQVFSTVRLANYVFDQTGQPDWTRIDDVGRAVVMYEAARSCRKTLKWYDEARHRDGFSTRAVKQIKLFKQAGTTPDDLDDITANMRDGYLKNRLDDISVIYREYENLIEGRFQDGEDEMNALCASLGLMDGIDNVHVFFYGFDMIPPIMQKLILNMSACAHDVTVLFPLIADSNSLDYFIYEPLSRAYARMASAAAEAGMPIRHISIPEPVRTDDIGCLAQNIFSVIPSSDRSAFSDRIRLHAAADLSSEAVFAASEIRTLIRKNSWRYGDVRILCDSPDDYRLSIQRAFSVYEVPVFMPESRPLQSHPLAVCMIYALDSVRSGFRQETVRSLLLTGYAGLTRHEAGLFSNYITKKDLRGKSFLKEITGDDAELYEPLRLKFMTPLLTLRDALRAASTLKDQATAIYGYLTDVEAYKTVSAHNDTLIEMDEWSLSTQAAQVYTRLIESLDQLVDILPDRRRPVKELSELLSQSLSAAELKMLPQSSDAVQVESLNRISTDKCKALFIMGLNDRGQSGSQMLISESEQHTLETKFDLWLGSNKKERVTLRQLYIKTALLNAGEQVIFTYPQSDNEGNATRRGSVIDAVREVYPAISIESSADTPKTVKRRMNSPKAIAGAISNELPSDLRFDAARVLASDPDGRAALMSAAKALSPSSGKDRISPAGAARLYGEIERISATRLETYAKCPHKHFLDYGLAPEKVEPGELGRKDAGIFCHEAVMTFVERHGLELGSITPDEASTRMGVIAENIAEAKFGADRSSTGICGARISEFIRASKRAAYTIAEHLTDSGFRPAGVEIPFGRNGTGIPLPGENMPVLEGKIDRVDSFRNENGNNVRIIDYKTGNEKFDFGKVYLAIQQQLFVYLAAAKKMYSAHPAGVFYFKVRDPLITDTDGTADIGAKRSAELRMNGIAPSGEDLLYAMSPSPESIIDASLKAKTGRHVMNESEFDDTIDHILNEDARMVREIRDGNADISPADLNNSTACTLCSANKTCPFVTGMPGYKKRMIPKLKFDELKASVVKEIE